MCLFVSWMLLSIACGGPGIIETELLGDTALPDTGDRGVPPPPEADWCLDYEEANLINAGYGDSSSAELYDGAIVFIAQENMSYSGYNGEEDLDLRGTFALGIRSSHSGDPTSVGIATTHVFLVEQDALFWWQLSEVDERGIYLGLDVLTEASDVLGSKQLPVETGGFLPGLEAGHESIPEIPELTAGEGTPGEMVLQALDLTPWLGQEVKVRFYQHTLIEGNGFFSLLDDICHGPAPVDPLPADELLEHGA